MNNIQKKKFAGRAVAVAVLVVGATITAALPASAATFMWLDGSVAPDGREYVETAEAGNFSRTGLRAEIPSATWKTTAWFNGYSVSGNGSAEVNGPRGWGTTKASFEFWDYHPGDTVQAKAWLLDAKLNGTSKSSPLGLLEQDSPDGPPVPTISAADLRAGDVEGLTLTSYGSIGAAELWTGINEARSCVYVVHGEYASSSCGSAGSGSSGGVSLHALSPDGESSLQVLYSPTGGLDLETTTGAGLTWLSDTVAVNSASPVSGAVRIPASAEGRSIVGAEEIIIPLLEVPE
ncbi:hypothetical protein [Microbacterium resistens]|uniref:hypothetical protein n=1 Tax=Microbacterium resistens TaxID=156977 RepID=UPI0012F7E859|nr:hypothetical protein [Microbacterium resistens]